MAGEPTPIFVLGLQRAGTTWVANCLGGHPDIAVIEAEDHRGAHESIFFSHFARAYGDLGDEAGYRRFLQDFMACDYFLLSGVSEQRYTARRHRSYPEAFAGLMDLVAADRGCRFWLEKSPDHTPLARRLSRDFPTARFVCVVRDAAGLARSRLWAYGRGGPRWYDRALRIVKGGIAISFYQRLLADFCAHEQRSLLVRYDDLVADTESGLREVTDFIGCGFDPGVLAERFAPNTSFDGDPGQAKRTFTVPDKAVLAVTMACCGLLPVSLLARIQSWKAGRTGVKWPPWCWKRRDRAAGGRG